MVIWGIGYPAVNLMWHLLQHKRIIADTKNICYDDRRTGLLFRKKMKKETIFLILCIFFVSCTQYQIPFNKKQWIKEKKSFLYD